MYKIIKEKIVLCSMLFLFACTLAGCAGSVEQPETQEETLKVMPGAYDSQDQALIIENNYKKQSITFYNFKLKKNYTLQYDGTTGFYDKYGSSLSVEQVKKGEVADIQFLKGQKLLSKVTISPQVWQLSEVEGFQLDLKAERIKVGNTTYTLSEDTVVFSGNSKAEYLDINSEDTLTLRGSDRKVYSIHIDKGHGYLRLENAEYFIGGWIELSRGIVRPIEEDMLITVPEGKHKVYVSHTGIEGEKEVKIVRGQETKLDLGDLKKEDLIKYGNLIFTLDPAEASVYIDGKEVDTTRTVKAEYGLHQIMATADGYETLIQYIRVSKEGATLSITLDKETEKTLSGNSTGKGNGSTNTNKTPTPLPSGSSGTTGNTGTTGNNTAGNNNSGSGTGSGNNTSGSNNSGEGGVSGNAGGSTGTTSGSNSGQGSNSDTVINSTGYRVEINAPVGAKLYVNNSYVGIIPTSFKKEEGSYELTLRKEGYKDKTYILPVDGTNQSESYSFDELEPK